MQSMKMYVHTFHVHARETLILIEAIKSVWPKFPLRSNVSFQLHLVFSSVIKLLPFLIYFEYLLSTRQQHVIY